ncbi:MAG: phosphotransferase [candidate division WOR-3 bacterium]
MKELAEIIRESGYELVEEITTGGSERKFWRIKKGTSTYIFIWDENITEYVRILKHLNNKGIGVPKLIEHHHGYAIVEDLGKDSLYGLMRRRVANWLDFYKKAVVELVKLQVDGFPKAPVNNYYDSEHIIWEQNYFKQFFLKQYCQIPDEKIYEIEGDLELLRKKLVEAIKSISYFLMHRDYQSQNIFVKNGKIRIVDFQSARIGPLTYDLASLLKDAYVEIDEKSEDILITYYLNCLNKKGIKISKDNFLASYQLTAIQRHMQALGAFANLSLNKGKKHFKNYIPRALELLNEELKVSEFRNFHRLVSTVKRSFNGKLP